MVTRPGSKAATFNSGELAIELYDRSDVKQFYAGAALMRNVEPVPQGGFRLIERSRDLAGERSKLAEIPATIATAGGALAAAGAAITLTFAAAALVAAFEIRDFSADKDLDACLVPEYQDAADGLWKPLGLGYAARTSVRTRIAARPPGSPVNATAVRLWYNGTGAPASFAFNGAVKAWRETGVLSDVQLVPFTVAAGETYMVVLTEGLADIFRDGAFVAAAAHFLPPAAIRTAVPLQRLATLLLHHPDAAEPRIARQGADHEWNTDYVAVTDIPAVDLGGSYVKTDEIWQLALRWPSAGSPAGYALTVAVDGEDSEAVFVPSPVDWVAFCATLKSKLEALAVVDPGITVGVNGTSAGLAQIDITFSGAGNSGAQFTVSARFVNTAEGGATALRLRKGDPGGEPLWSASRGYPACATFYQDRLVRAGFKAKPGAALASPTADYFSGNVDLEAATGGILVNLDTDGAETIQRLARSKHLVIFTSDAEYFVSDRQLSRAQPVNIVESSRNGSCATAPICSTETALLYVSRSRSLVYSATYDDVAQAYVSTPLSILASHLMVDLAGAALQRARAKGDAARYFLTRDDGLMPVGVLIQSQEVTAFVRWETDGKVRAVAVDGANRVYLSVERLTGGVWKRRLEWLEPGLLLDGAVTKTLAPAATVVAGLEIHEGAQVWAIADGWVLGPYTVAAGQITLPIAAASVTVGRWTAPCVETLPLPREVAPRTVLERPCRVYAVMLKLIATTSLAIGANGEPPEEVPLYRAGMATDLPQPPLTEKLELTGLEGWTIEGQVVITQTRPGALQIGAVTIQAKT